MELSPYIITYTGKIFDLREMTFDIIDIAHSLSQTNRWGGHTPNPYSVAQHSLSVYENLKNYPPTVQLSGLMHDASEAYICDIPSPFKDIFIGYKDMENKIMEKISSYFGFEWPMPEIVKKVDYAVLCAEMDLFWGDHTHVHENLPEPEIKVNIIGDFFDSKTIREKFLNAYKTSIKMLSGHINSGD